MASDASPVSPVTVPLQVTYVEHTGHKVGIQAGFSPDGYRLYEFDTGGDGFWSGYSPQWWPEQSGPPVQNTYASGAGYTGVAVNVPVYLADASGNAPAAVAQATVAQIQTATGKWTGDQWQQMIGSNQPPLYGNYYGDFGASLKGKQEADGLVLWSVLFQLAGGLGNGFVVSLDAFPGAQAPASGSLQLGLSASELSGTANQIALVPIQNGPGLTAQGILYIDDEPVNVGTGGTGAEPPPVDVLFDTGTPSTRIWTGENLSQEVLMKYAAGPANKNDRTSIAPGHTLRLVCGGVTVMSFQTGTTVGLDEVSFSPAKPSGPGQPSGGSVNTGLQPFWGNRTTFNRNADGTGGFIALANAASPTS